MLKRLFLLSICFSLAVVCTHAQQPQQQNQTKEELQKQRKQLEDEINELNRNLNAIQKNKKQSLTQLAIIQRKVAKREQLINNINKEMHHIDDDIQAKEIEKDRYKKELDTLKQRYAQSIVFAYKNRSNYEYLNFLFSASDFNDAFKRLTYLKSYRRYRETEVQTILKTQDLLQQTIGTLNSSKVEKSKALLTQSSQLKVLEDDKKEKDQVVRQLKDQEKDLIAQQKKKEKERQQLNKALAAVIRRAMDEEERKAKLAKQKADDSKKTQASKVPSDNNVTITKGNPSGNKNLRNADASTGVVTAGGNEGRSYNVLESTPEGLTQSINFENNRGRLPWPVSGGNVVGRFGTQTVPGTKLTTHNDGIIISTQIGASVKCIADGEVIAVADLDEYQYAVVRHGKYFTVYNKLSQVNISKGEMLKAGSLVGKAAVGFDGGGEIEIQVMNDKRQFLDPEKWLKSR